MLPGEMAEGVETREQRRRRRIGLGLDPDGESDEEHGDEGHAGEDDGDGGNPGLGDGGDPGGVDGGGPGGPGEEEGEEESIDPADDATTRAFKRQTNSLVMLAKSIKELVSKKEDGEYYMDAATGIRKVRKRISPPYLQRRQRRETRSPFTESKGLV